MRSAAAPETSRLATILHDTVGHQEHPGGYGSSPFGFWGQREGVRGLLWEPRGDGTMTRPVMLLFLALVAGSFFLGRGTSPAQLALLVAALGIAAQLVKVHGTGVYVAWYYPFLLLGLCAGANRTRYALATDHATRDTRERR
jgi:hypothetical protein